MGGRAPCGLFRTDITSLPAFPDCGGVVTAQLGVEVVAAVLPTRIVGGQRRIVGNRVKSKIRARVEHVFAQEKAHMGLYIRTIGIRRAEAKIALVNLAYNMKRLIFHERRTAA